MGPAQKGGVAGKHFVEHRARAVPVAGRGDGPSRGLFGGHVGARAQDVWQQALVQPRGPQVGGKPEVKNHETALPGHQHVRGFQVAVELARLMEDGDPLGQLQESDPQPGQGSRREAESAMKWDAVARPRSASGRRVRCRRWHPGLFRDRPVTMGWAVRGTQSSPGPGLADRSPIAQSARKSTPSMSSMVKNQIGPSVASS